MSVVAAPAASEDEARNARLAAAGLLAGAGGLAVAVTYTVTWNSTTLVEPHQTAVARALLVAAWIAVGSLMAWRRVDRGVAVLVASAGFLYSVQALTAVSDARAYTVGRVVLSALTVYVAYVALRVAHDLLGAPLRRRFIGALSAALAVLWALTASGRREAPSVWAVRVLRRQCPHNGLNVVDWPRAGASPGHADHADDRSRRCVGVAVPSSSTAPASAPPRRRYAYAPLIYALSSGRARTCSSRPRGRSSWGPYDTFLRFIAAVGAVGTPRRAATRRGAAARRSRRGGSRHLSRRRRQRRPNTCAISSATASATRHAALAVFDEPRGWLRRRRTGSPVEVEPRRQRRARCSCPAVGRVVAGALLRRAPTDHPAARALAGAA